MVLTFYACKAKKTSLITNNKTEKVIDNTNSEDTKSIKSKQSEFNSFATKANTKLTLGDKSYNVDLTIRIKKGSTIWVSVMYFGGLEAARVLITPDSIKLRNNLNSEYLKKPFSFIQSLTNNQIDYQTLESILVGNCIPFILKGNSSLTRSNNLVSLTGQNGEIAYHVSLNTQHKPQSTLLYNQQKQNLTVKINIFENIANQLFPQNIEITSVTEKKQIKVLMDYSKTQINETLDFPFNVPKRFSVID